MAVNNIDELKGLISQKKGIARGNIYRVFLPSLPGASASEVNLLCTGVSLPGRQIMTQERKIGLVNQKVAYDQAYDDVQLNFLLLNDYGIRNYFETWQNLAINQNTYEVGYLNEYTFDVRIQQLAKGFGLPVYQTSLGLPKLPALIQNRLPKIGPFDIARGVLDIDFITGDQVVYEVILQQAFPTTLNSIELSNSMEDIMELGIQLSYRNWKSATTSRTTNQSFTNTVIGTLATRLF